MFDISYLERAKKKKDASAGAPSAALMGPAPKKARTAKGSASTASQVAVSDAPVRREGPEVPPSSSSQGVVSGPTSRIGSPSRQSLLSSSEFAWQKLIANVSEVEMGELRGTLSGKMATELNHDLFKAMTRSFAFYNRLADTERMLATERKKREEVMIELEKAKNVAAVAEAEREEILQLERRTNEENKILKTDRARLDREVQQEKKKVSRLENEVAQLKEEAENVGSVAIANFKETDDFQAVLIPVFLEGFEHAKAKFSTSFPELDISKIVPGSSSEGPGEQDKEEGNGEEHAVAEVNAKGVTKVSAEGITEDANVQAAEAEEEAVTTVTVD